MIRVLVCGNHGRNKTSFFTELKFSNIEHITPESIKKSAGNCFGCSHNWVDILSVAIIDDHKDIVSEIIEAIQDFCDGLDSMMNTMDSSEIADMLNETLLIAAKRQGGAE